MLQYLHITNFALIDDVELSFDSGMNVITGETGAGKSLLMQAIGIALGSRATTDVVRHQAQEAVVEALFDINDYPDMRVAQLLEESGYPPDEELLIRRVIPHTGRSRVYLNGALATVALLRRLGVELLQVYGQHEQQTLLEAEAAQQLLDRFAGLGSRVLEMQRRYRVLRDAWNQLQALTAGKDGIEARRELLRFQVDEIARAELRAGEEETLRQEKTILLNAEKLHQGVLACDQTLATGDDALSDQLGRVMTQLRDCTRLDDSLTEVLDLLHSGLAQIEEAALSLRRYGERLTPNPERLEEIETRLGRIAQLKKKYGGSVEAILNQHETLSQELASLEGGEESLTALQQDVEAAAEAAWRWAAELSRDRQTAARTLETKMIDELAGLGMPGATFSVRFHTPQRSQEEEEPFVRDQARLSSSGCDQLEFFLSANPGEPLLPLVNVASGGELSRLMLALKALSVEAKEAPTLIFDEVDAGIGGGVAEVVGRRLKALSAQRQVLCITHLPQIAAFAEHAYTVVKTVTKGRTVSSAKKLSKTEHLNELARMLGGVEISTEAKRHAREMLQGARRRSPGPLGLRTED